MDPNPSCLETYLCKTRAFYTSPIHSNCPEIGRKATDRLRGCSQQDRVFIKRWKMNAEEYCFGFLFP
jgi:hypothetical protein